MVMNALFVWLAFFSSRPDMVALNFVFAKQGSSGRNCHAILAWQTNRRVPYFCLCNLTRHLKACFQEAAAREEQIMISHQHTACLQQSLLCPILSDLILGLSPHWQTHKHASYVNMVKAEDKLSDLDDIRTVKGRETCRQADRQTDVVDKHMDKQVAIMFKGPYRDLLICSWFSSCLSLTTSHWTAKRCGPKVKHRLKLQTVLLINSSLLFSWLYHESNKRKWQRQDNCRVK